MRDFTHLGFLQLPLQLSGLCVLLWNMYVLVAMHYIITSSNLSSAESSCISSLLLVQWRPQTEAECKLFICYSYYMYKRYMYVQ